jgi:hypothetical protein
VTGPDTKLVRRRVLSRHSKGLVVGSSGLNTLYYRVARKPREAKRVARPGDRPDSAVIQEDSTRTEDRCGIEVKPAATPARATPKYFYARSTEYDQVHVITT